MHVSKVYKLTLEPLSSHVWYSVVAAVTEFCEAKLLWSEGIVWHQGPVECVLLAQNTGKSAFFYACRIRGVIFFLLFNNFSCKDLHAYILTLCKGFQV